MLSINTYFTSMFSESSTVYFITTAFLIFLHVFMKSLGLVKATRTSKHHHEFPTHGLQKEVNLFLEGHHLGIKFKTTRKPRDHQPIQLARAQVWQLDWSQGAQIILCHFPKAQETKACFTQRPRRFGDPGDARVTQTAHEWTE